MMLRGFLVALQFLTRISVRRDLRITDRDLANSAAFFPIVGMFIGGAQALVFFLSGWVLSPSVTALFLLLVPVILTGAFHIEGLGDMADGFLGGKDKEDILRIMKDSHVGTMGMTAVVCLILAKYIFLCEIVQALSPSIVIGVLLLAPGLSRWGMVIAAGVSQYARLPPYRGGIGRAFAEGVGGKIVLLSGFVPVVATAIYLRMMGGFCIAITILLALIASWLAKRRINGVTGDVLGGINEITEVVLLLSVIIMTRTSCLGFVIK